MDEILKFIERVQGEEKHLRKCKGITSYTDGVDYWDEIDLNKCDCNRWQRINQRIAEMWYANLARPMKYLLGKCTCGHAQSWHTWDSRCNVDGCQCLIFKEIK